MGATKIMIIRHAEKPGIYGGQNYNGVDAAGASCAAGGVQSLVTIGWQRAGGLITLFAPPWGPKSPTLARPQTIYTADPGKNGGKLPSQRLYKRSSGLQHSLGLVSTSNRSGANTPNWPRMRCSRKAPS